MLEITQALCLLLVSGLYSFTLESSDFHLIDLLKNYEDAKRYCREMYTDLATIHNFTDMTNLINYVSDTSVRAWIGLEIGKPMWHWSLPDQQLNYINWRKGDPQENDLEKCAAMDENGKWFESDCKSKRSFVCHGNEGTSSHVLVTNAKSWRDAQDHCRGLSTDLVSINSTTENEVVSNMSPNVWIGLFKDPWKWSDGSNSSFRYWRPFQPNYINGQDCVTAILKNSGQWNDLKCSGKRNFICRGASKSPTTIQTSTQGATIVTNMTTLSDVTSERVIVTSHFTVALNNTNSSSVSTTASLVFSSSTEHLSLTSTPVTTQGISALYTTQSLTLHSNTPGTLILIQQNMTWVEATAYCREHYIDLVSISTPDIQQMVAEKVKKATTPHVWIGLRYTCGSKVWFWTRSASGCYQNWAPEQGTEEKSSCGFAGAIEATGRQQWVGLPRTEKINFICYACIG